MGILEETLASLAELRQIVQEQSTRLNRLESLQDEWVTVKETEKRTGKDRKTLLKEANRKGSLLKTKIEGKRTRLYSANSIVNYNNRKVLNRQEPDSPMKIAS